MDIEQQILAELQNKDWQLVRPDQDSLAWRAFVQSIEACIARSGNIKRLAYCVTVAYSPVLFQAANSTTDRRGRERAFTELFHWIYPRLIVHYHVPENAAQEIAQEILIVIFQKLKDVDRPKGFFPFVSQIIYNKVREYRRAQAKNKEESLNDSEDDEDLLNQIPDESDSVDPLRPKLDEEDELLRKIEACMPVRAKRQKAIIRALVFEGLTYHEIAVKWDTNEGALYTLWNHAKKNLITHCRELIKDILERHHLIALLEDL